MGKYCLIIFVAMLANATAMFHKPFSSCSENGETPWVKARPHRTKSWLGSIVPRKPIGQHVNETKDEPIAYFSENPEKGELTLEYITAANGISWKKYGNEQLDGWLYGHFEAGNATGHKIAYIFSDLRTAFLGHFEKGVMIKARATRVTKTRYIHREAGKSNPVQENCYVLGAKREYWSCALLNLIQMPHLRTLPTTNLSTLQRNL